MFLMFANAAMFNSTGHDVNLYAKEMAFATIDECMYIVSNSRCFILSAISSFTNGCKFPSYTSNSVRAIKRSK